jgi:hypothetical protein
MAENPYVNKVVFGNDTLLDLTEDSVTENTLLEGETAHSASGAPVTGTAKQGHIIWNAIKTALTQRTKLWFADAKVTDDSTEQATKVEVVQLIDDEDELDDAPDGVYQGDYDDAPEDVLDASMVAYKDGSVEDALDELTDKVVYVNDSTTFTLPSIGSSVDVQKAVSLSGYRLVGIINVSPNTANVAIGTFAPLSNGNAFMSFINVGNSSQVGQSRNATWTNVFVKQ